MNFRVKAAFWGVLMGILLCSGPGFSQMAQVGPAPAASDGSTAGQSGGTAPSVPTAPSVGSTAGQIGALVPSAPAAPSSSGSSLALPYYPSPTSPSEAVTPSQVFIQGAAAPAGTKSQLMATQEPELSPIEQYVSGKIPQTLTFDIKQFGYDLFFPSPAAGPSQQYPPAGPASQGSTSQGYVPSTPAPQGGVPQGYTPSGQVPPGGGAQGYAPSGPTPQGAAPQGYGPSGLVPQGGVPQGYAPVNPAAQGGAPQGYVPPSPVAQGGVSQGPVPPGAVRQATPPSPVPSGGIPPLPPPSGTPAPSGGASNPPSLRNTMLSMSPSNVPVGPDYVVGPGDEVRIAVWGSIEGTWNAEVDRDGNINVPKLGTLGVTGLSFQELKEVLRKELSKYFKDFQMNVTMGTLRTMTVYVVGNAQAPGAYSISSLATIINALVVAGGPSKAGTMRDIQLKRKGETVAHLDLYDFLIAGDKTRDQRLLPEDVIFIPPIGPIVGVAGNVDRPAIYELRGKTMLSEGIKMAGGVTAAARVQRVQVERVFQTQMKIIVDVSFDKFKGRQDVPLQDGDIVKVFPILPVVTNKVVLQGNVKWPGDYEWKSGMRARDLLPSADSLLPDSFLDYALITRLMKPDGHQEYRSFDLGAVVFRGNQENNILLEPYDVVTIFNKWELVPKEKVRLTGAVNRPGEFDFRPNMKLSDLLKLGGGLSKQAFRSKAELTRVTPMASGPLTQQIVVNPEEALAGNPGEDIGLQGDDYLFVRAVPDWHLYRKVRLTGEVNFPGDYALSKGERLSSLLERAGGFTEKAYPRGTVLTRASVREMQQQQLGDMIARLQQELLALSAASVAGATDMNDAQIQVAETKQKQAFLDGLRQIRATGRMVVNVEEARKAKNGALDVEMEDGDTLNIPTNPQTVQVIGAVNNQSSFVFVPTKDYSYYIDKAGGFNKVAEQSEVYIVKVDGSTITPGWGFFWSSSGHQWEAGSPGLIEAGDTIVVPVQLERIAWLRDLKDLTQILYQATLGGAVVWKLFQ